jgi:hypothetical protein
VTTPGETVRAHRWDAPRAERWAYALLIAAGGAIAIVLRTVQLRDQIVVFDEWHSLRAATDLGYRGIYGSFGLHSSIPVSLYLRAALDTVGLGLVTYRGPFLLAGLGLVLLPLAALRGRARLEGTVLFLVFAIHPLLVYHSRFARPYAMALPCALVALWAAWRWWTTGRARAGTVYALFAGLTGWFTLAYLPFALAPLAAIAVAPLLGWRSRGSPSARAWLLVALGTAALLGVLVGPAWLADARTVENKLGREPGAIPWLAVLRFATGADSIAFGALWLALALGGAVVAARRVPALTAFVSMAAIAQVGAVGVLAPYRLEVTPFLARYVLPAIAVGLGFAAVGMAAWARAVEGRLSAYVRGPWALALACAFLAAAARDAPLEELFVRPSSWANEQLAFRLERRGPSVPKLVAREPAVYRELASRAPGTVTVIEAPYTALGLLLPFHSYQLRHRQRVLVAAETGACEAANSTQLPRLASLELPGVTYLADPEALRRSGAELLIVHRRPAEEMSYYRPRQLADRRLRMSGEECVEVAERSFGPPVFSDSDVAVFRLR